MSLQEYAALCEGFPKEIELIESHTVSISNAKLVRYYDVTTPLFGEPLLSELRKYEFCYKPIRLVALPEYFSVYQEVWRSYADNIDESYDFIIFDGSLIHNQMNDMMSNYKIDGRKAALHIKQLLNAFGVRKKHVFYLESDNVAEQLIKADMERKHKKPSDDYIAFWKKRYENDKMILEELGKMCCVYNISKCSYKEIMQDICERCNKSGVDPISNSRFDYGSE